MKVTSLLGKKPLRRRLAVIGAALIGEDGVRDVTIVRATMLRPSISAASPGYPSPTVGFPPWYRFATNALLLRYSAGGGCAMIIRWNIRPNERKRIF